MPFGNCYFKKQLGEGIGREGRRLVGSVAQGILQIFYVHTEVSLSGSMCWTGVDEHAV